MTRKLTPAQLDEIKAAAKEASSVHGRGWHSEVSLERDTHGRIPAWHRDAKHIATMDPATTLALIAEVRELRAKVERVETEVRAEAQRARPRPGESSPDAVRRSVSRAIAERLTKALGEGA